MRLCSQVYSSCLARHAWDSRAPLPGQKLSQRRATEWTSNSVPYASNTRAFDIGGFSVRASTGVNLLNVKLERTMLDRYEELYKGFRWNVPARYNIARDCCGRWASDAARIALHWEDESGAAASYSFGDIQRAANRLSNALAGLGVQRGDRVALLVPQRPQMALPCL